MIHCIYQSHFHAYSRGFSRDIDTRELGPDEVVNLKSFVPDLGRFLVRPTDRLLVEIVFF